MSSQPCPNVGIPTVSFSAGAPWREKMLELFLRRNLGEPPCDGVVDIEVMSGMLNFVLFTSPKQRAVVP